jgi:ribosomal protein L21E
MGGKYAVSAGAIMGELERYQGSIGSVVEAQGVSAMVM